jgi:hypothetical protein
MNIYPLSNLERLGNPNGAAHLRSLGNGLAVTARIAA